MKIFVSLPVELLSENTDRYWRELYPKVQKEFPHAEISSSYCGNGSIEGADAIIFIYEYKDTKRCREDMERCRELNKPYNFFRKVYAEDFE